jgi:hypothetical protein
MKLFPDALLSWQEPASYMYGRSSKNKWLGLLFPIIAIAGVIQLRQVPWWMILALIPLVAIIGLLPWMHSRWPLLFPLTGPRVTLYDDRIARQSGKSQTSIALDNITECRITARNDKDGSYSVLSFTPKSTGFGGQVFGVLTETAVSDATVTDQIITYLRERGIVITEAK